MYNRFFRHYNAAALFMIVGNDIADCRSILNQAKLKSGKPNAVKGFEEVAFIV